MWLHTNIPLLFWLSSSDHTGSTHVFGGDMACSFLVCMHVLASMWRSALACEKCVTFVHINIHVHTHIHINTCTYPHAG
jgi:hypothetical protein